LLWPRSGPAGKGPSAFEHEVAALERQLGLTTFGKLWVCSDALDVARPLQPSCCTIELMAVVGARYDIARFGMEFFRASSRQADLMIE
jgi:NADH-quinone oxidoreductase subunit B